MLSNSLIKITNNLSLHEIEITTNPIIISLFIPNSRTKKAKKGDVTTVVPMPDLDMNTPEGALKSNRKIQASLKDGENCWYYWEGNFFSRVPGEKDRLLFTYIAINVRNTKIVIEIR